MLFLMSLIIISNVTIGPNDVQHKATTLQKKLPPPPRNTISTF